MFDKPSLRSAVDGIRRSLASAFGLAGRPVDRSAPTCDDGEPRGRSAGVAAIWIALLAAVFFGVVSLGTEVVLALQQQRRMQAAADSAAIAAAISLSREEQTWEQEGYAVAGKAGFTSPTHACAYTGPDLVSIWHPCDGPLKDDPTYVEAIIRKPFDIWLARPLGLTGVQLQARAVASLEAAWGCIAVLDPDPAKWTFRVSGTPIVTFNDCAVIVNSTAEPAARLDGGAMLKCPHIFIGGTQEGIDQTACRYTEHARGVDDPYRTVNPTFVSSPPAITAKRTAAGNVETITPVDVVGNPNGLNPVLLRGGIPSKDSPPTIKTWKFCPGIYVIDGAPSGGSPGDAGKFDLTASGMSVQLLAPSDPACVNDTGTGIAFVLTSSGAASRIPSVKVQSGSSLGTPTQALKGIDDAQSAASGADVNTRLPPNTLFWQNRLVPLSGSGKSNFDGTTNLAGVLYFPHQLLELGGNATASSPCFQAIAWDLTINGNADLTITGCSFATKTAIAGRALLVE